MPVGCIYRHDYKNEWDGTLVWISDKRLIWKMLALKRVEHESISYFSPALSFIFFSFCNSDWAYWRKKLSKCFAVLVTLIWFIIHMSLFCLYSTNSFISSLIIQMKYAVFFRVSVKYTKFNIYKYINVIKRY